MEAPDGSGDAIAAGRRLIVGWVSPVPETRPVAKYRLFSSEGELLYVGSTHDPKRRLYQHSRVKPWWPEVAWPEVTWYEGRQAAEDAEKIAIMVGNPRYNIGFKQTFCDPRAWIWSQFGLVEEGRDHCLPVELIETPVSARIASLVGIEAGTPFARARYVITRDGVPAWVVTEWQSPRPGWVDEPCHQARERRSFLVYQEERRESDGEAQALGLAAGHRMSVHWYAQTNGWRGRDAILEAAVPVGDVAGWDLDGASVEARPADG